MKNLNEVSETVKRGSYLISETVRYKRAVPNFRFSNLIFKESDFKILLDLHSFTTRQGKILRVGDICQLIRFPLSTSSGKYPDIRNTSKGNWIFYVILGFAKLSSKNHEATFCVLMNINIHNSAEDLRLHMVPKTMDDALVFYWPESLELKNME